MTPTLLRLLLPRFHFPSQFYPMTNEDDFTDPGTDSEGDYKEDDLGLTSDDVEKAKYSGKSQSSETSEEIKGRKCFHNDKEWKSSVLMT